MAFYAIYMSPEDLISVFPNPIHTMYLKETLESIIIKQWSMSTGKVITFN